MGSNFSIIILISKIPIGVNSSLANKIDLITMYLLPLILGQVLILGLVLQMLMVNSLHVVATIDIGRIFKYLSSLIPQLFSMDTDTAKFLILF